MFLGDLAFFLPTIKPRGIGISYLAIFGKRVKSQFAL